MGWGLGYDRNWDRDVGYGVPAVCDQPGCDEKIDRGLSYVCGSDPYGGEYGCGLFFCGKHLLMRTPRGEDRCYQNCKRCLTYRPPYKPKPDAREWVEHKLNDPSWGEWRDAYPDKVKAMRQIVCEAA
jgi:hypothetical protein